MARETYYVASVAIEGYTPLMMHKMSVDALSAGKGSIKTQETTYEDEWMKTIYEGIENGEKVLICPSANLEAMFLVAAKGKKIRKTFLTSLVPQLVINDSFSPILIKGKTITKDDVRENDWLDVRSAVVSKNRVARVRACLPVGWRIEFDVEVRSKLISPEMLKSLIEDAGELVGLMDYRPAKKGKFGQFEVVKFEVQGE